MLYTGSKQITIDAQGLVYTNSDEAIEARNTSDDTSRYWAELLDSND